MPQSIQVTQQDIDAFLVRYNAENANRKYLLKFDEVRRKALMGWDDLQACPGSGKTTLIAAKLMIIAKKWNAKYQGVCVLTHTNVACEEIRARLKNDVDGYKLLTYPHFIGTIQEFMNRFLGLPFIRNEYEFSRFVEADIGKIEVRRASIDRSQVQQICKNLYGVCDRANYEKIKDYLGSLHYINAALDLRFFKQNSSVEVVKAASSSARRKMLETLKQSLCERGIFNYRDVYSFSDKLILENRELTGTLQFRFPFVFIDEMQDTQKFQDEIINTIFDSDMVKIQRFGDPDQAIFDSMGGDEPNKTFNSNKKLEILAHSHRFSAEIADKVSTLSLKNIGEIVTSPTAQPKLEHTVFIFNDKSKAIVLEQFSKLVAECDPDNEWETLKAIGAVGHSDNHELHLGAYFNQFDKQKQVKQPKPQRLIDAVNREWWKSNNNSEFQYKLIVQSFLDLMRIAEKYDVQTLSPKYFNHNSFKTWLITGNKYVKFREIITHWIFNLVPNVAKWTIQANYLKKFFELPDSDAVNRFLAYSDEAPQEQDSPKQNASNIYIAENDREVEVGTIHSVKGETHDATLVLETKNYCNDLQAMLLFLTGERPSEQHQNSDLSLKPHHSGKPNQQFMQQLYVAFSRPKHLLCIALHQQSITEKQKTGLEDKGWTLNVLD
jgi:DNA helicase-2/ATP-dependent DNA helicase PcrA